MPTRTWPPSVRRYAHAWYHTTKHNTVLASTGSTFIWAMHMRWAREHAAAETAELLSAADWGKCSYCDGWRSPWQWHADPPARRLRVEPNEAAAPPSLAPQLQQQQQLLPPQQQFAAMVSARVASAHADSAAAARLATGASADPRVRLGGSGGARSDGVEEGGAGVELARRVDPAWSLRAEWSSPFVHGEGSSWHSVDSVVLMALFCHLDWLTVVSLVGLVWLRSRSRSATACCAAGLFLLVGVHRSLNLIVLETFFGRPWIYLLMG